MACYRSQHYAWEETCHTEPWLLHLHKNPSSLRHTQDITGNPTKKVTLQTCPSYSTGLPFPLQVLPWRHSLRKLNIPISLTLLGLKMKQLQVQWTMYSTRETGFPSPELLGGYPINYFWKPTVKLNVRNMNLFKCF